MIFVLIVLLSTTAAAFWVRSRSEEGADINTRAWEQAVANERSQVGRMLLGVSKRIGAVPAVQAATTSAQFRFLESKLLGAGGVYAASVEVFLAVQVLCLFIGAVMMVGLFFAGVSGVPLFAGVVFAATISAYPYNTVSKKAKVRAEAVSRGLPEFAELLQMPLAGGMGVLPALAFTSERLTGPVSDEVRNLLIVLNSRALPEPEAFKLAASRLGTSEAQAFFTALMQASLEGAKVAKNLAAQAAALRISAHQRARGEAKKLPVKLVIIIAVHLMPMLFAVALLPTLLSLGNI